MRTLHICDDIFDDGELVRSMGIGKCQTKFLFFFSKLPERDTTREISLGIGLEDFLSNCLDFFISLR